MVSTPFCEDCPDHEACSQGAPCDLVKQVHAGTVAAQMEEFQEACEKARQSMFYRFAEGLSKFRLLSRIRRYEETL